MSQMHWTQWWLHWKMKCCLQHSHSSLWPSCRTFWTPLVSRHDLFKLQSIHRSLQARRQLVLINTAERLVHSGRKCDRRAGLLQDLLWLRVPERIAFHLAVLVFHYRNKTASQYMGRRQLQRATDDNQHHLSWLYGVAAVSTYDCREWSCIQRCSTSSSPRHPCEFSMDA